MDYLDYFKNNKGFERFMVRAKEKYQSYGKVTGTITLDNITYEESISLTDFFARKFEEGKTYKIKISEFNKVLERSKFQDFEFTDYFSNTYDDFSYLTNTLKKRKFQEEFISFIEDLLLEFKSDKLKEFFIENTNKNFSTMRNIRKKFKEDRKTLRNELLVIDKLLSNVPDKITYLPIYASITSNPHYLDYNANSSSLFYKILSYILDEEIPTTNLDKTKLLEKINVYTDPLSNYVITYNLVYDRKMPFDVLNLNIDNISKLNNITGKGNKIFIFENPSILNYLKDKDLDISIIITSGIPNLAFYKLLENVNRNTTLYYNGDYDPEGLLIADKLNNKYSNIKLFLYDRKSYLNTKPSVSISNNRLHKLELVKSKELQEVNRLLLENKKCGYQENNLLFIEKFIKMKLEEKL